MWRKLIERKTEERQQGKYKTDREKDYRARQRQEERMTQRFRKLLNAYCNDKTMKLAFRSYKQIL